MSEIFIPLQESDPEMWFSLREFIENFDDPMLEDGYFPSGKEHPMYGLKHSEETKLKIAEAVKKGKLGKKRKPFTEETRKKMSEARMGDKNPRYGRKHSAETIKKMSKAKLGNTFAKKK